MKLSEAIILETKSQDDEVKRMEDKGWEVWKTDRDGKVVMTKGDKEAFIYPSGKKFFPPKKR